MQATIFKVLQALNDIEVKGEHNHDLLLYSIQQLKRVQNAMLEAVENATKKEEPTDAES